jgi:DNA-directed RNA polymerase subunit E'
MFYKTKLKDYVSLSPDLFEGDLNASIKEQITRNYADKTTEEFGLVVSVISVDGIGQGFKLPEDSSRHYVVEFTVLTYKPQLHEVIEGEVTSVTNFGVFINLGIVDGLIHLSQTMVDQVSFSKVGSIQGSQTGQALKAGDLVRASVIAVSFKDIRNVKIGLTMRQPGLGAYEWLNTAKE